MIGPSGRLTVDGLLETAATAMPDRDLLVFEGEDGRIERYTWAEIARSVEALAWTLQDLGVRPGAKVNLHLGNRPSFLVAWFACAWLGAAIVPTNTASSGAELTYQLVHSESELCVTQSSFEPQLREVVRGIPQVREVLVESAIDLRTKRVDAGVPHASRSTDTLAILYTSGTTSRPKGVMVSHAAYAYAGTVVAQAVRLTEEDRFLTVLPLFHGNAQYYSVMSVLVSRATLLLVERFSASRYFAQAEAHGATVGSLFAAPARMILARAPESGVRHRMRAMVFAQNLSEGHLQEWNKRFGVPIIQLYGMTETVGPPTFNPLGPEARPTSIGRVSPGYVCRVVDEEGHDVPVGQPGQLLVWGAPGLSLMSGYYKDPDATAAALRDNWLWTGDVVRLEGDGFFYFVDRTKDMMKVAGENVAASEVESVIRLHAGVFDAAVLGVPDEIRDERIVAFVVARDERLSADDVTAWCRERLAGFRVPSEVVLVTELPRTAVGKIQKHVLKARHLAAAAGTKKPLSP